MGLAENTNTKNETVLLESVGEKRSVMQLIMSRKLTFFSHYVRRDNLHRVILEGRIPSRRPKGKKRSMWIDNIGDWVGRKHYGW